MSYEDKGMTKHTPGPWVAAHRATGIEHDLRGLERISIGQPCRGSLTQFEETVCWIIPDVFGSAENEANARLIAAAPDLLEALKDYVGETDKVGLSLRGVHAKRMALDAIRKAEGGTE